MTAGVEIDASRRANARNIETENAANQQPPSTLIRCLKFNLVGGIGVVVQFGALFVLKGVLNFPYLAATAIAVEAAVIHNFVWHERFTWADRLGIGRSRTHCEQTKLILSETWRDSVRRLLRFQLANGAVSLVGNLALMKVMVGLKHMNYLAANAIAILLCALANFLVSDEWVFAEID